MKGYKGYSKGLICRDKQYAENAVFEEESAEIRKSGMHFCDLPHAVFEYYPPGDSEYTEVEALADCVTDNNFKYSTTKLAIGAKVDVFDLVKISVNAFFEKHNFAKRISEVKEKKGAANAGDYGAANAGCCGAANAGCCGAAIVREGGSASVGKGDSNSAFAGKAKGKLGALLVLCAVEGDRITDHVAVIVDGEKIKADTYYVLNDGKVREWDENEED